ncbi:MAG: 50S ribosomal protein L21e [Candidatus Micrarchaeota archaeon]|nr:50S ribosomal protein L21e [Candidatus Micrarchaeota archaeon]MDE1824519.1 50S ribosomal protein L21e [Candidatus Micrarchaeota archaeon]MDE1849269.1 50S ribosomal protein L21e [Candidatus Micrarchaeota archaeon]
MTGRSHGLFVGRTRQLARHNPPSRLGISKLLKSFAIGSRVLIMPKGNFNNIPHPRYRGRVGTVVEKRGGAYVVEVHTSKSTIRKLVVPQMHLDKA